MKKLPVLALGAALALTAPLAASAQMYGPPMHHGVRDFDARVASINGSAITLDDGKTVFLKQGTVINGRLHPGARIHVHGFRAGNGNTNAQTVTVLHHHM
jgi:hypothetical protein